MENVFLAIDFTDASKNAAAYAANVAGYFGCKLTVFHAYHAPITNFETGYIPPLTDMKIESEKEMKKFVAELISSHKELEVETCIEMGLAGDIITEHAAESNADLIVMGIAGQNSIIKEHLVGSVATQIAQESKIPVLIVPEHCKYSKIKNVAFACDFDRHLEDNTTLLKVKYFASLFDSELQILNVMKPTEEVSEQKAEVEVFIEDKLQNTKHQTYFIYEEKFDKGIVEFIEMHKSDLIITSPKKHNFFHNLFIESHTKKLVFHSPVPILAIHE